MLILFLADLITGHKTFHLFHYSIAIKFGLHNLFTEITISTCAFSITVKFVYFFYILCMFHVSVSWSMFWKQKRYKMYLLLLSSNPLQIGYCPGDIVFSLTAVHHFCPGKYFNYFIFISKNVYHFLAKVALVKQSIKKIKMSALTFDVAY